MFSFGQLLLCSPHHIHPISVMEREAIFLKKKKVGKLLLSYEMVRINHLTISSLRAWEGHTLTVHLH
jgi:hypothetical protein